MALLDFSITPLGAGESVSQYVALAVEDVSTAAASTIVCTP